MLQMLEGNVVHVLMVCKITGDYGIWPEEADNGGLCTTAARKTLENKFFIVPRTNPSREEPS